MSKAHFVSADETPTTQLVDALQINAGRAIDAVLVEQATSESGNKNTDGKLDAEYEGGAPLNHEEQYQGKNKEAWESPPLPVDFRDVAEGSLEKADRNYMRTTPAEVRGCIGKAERPLSTLFEYRHWKWR